MFVGSWIYPSRQKDGDEDGKLNFDEYFVGLFDSILDDDGPYNHSATLGQAKMLFSKLDQDNDGYKSGKLLTKQLEAY